MSKTFEELEKENKLLREQSAEYKKVIQQTDKLSSSTKSLYDENKNYIGKWSLDITTIATDTSKTIGSMIKEFATVFDASPFEELDVRATQLQKTFGSTKGQLESYKQIIADTIPELIKMGITEDEAVTNIGNIMKSVGSNASLGVEAITELSAAAKVGGVEIGQLATNFRDVGVSIYDVGDRMKEVTDIARAAGVSVAGVSNKVASNLSNMNLYNFDNGVKGLAKMAVTSERLGISMDKVFTQAEKLMDPDKAIDMSAALQRLGVTSSGLLDPLRAMDMAQNDPEALQKEMVNLGKEFTRFNETTGQMEILPGAKRRMREVADAVGLLPDEFAKMALRAGDFDKKMQEIKFPSLATDQETKEMIAGMAQLKDGKAQINVKNEKGEFDLKKVDELTSDDIASLKKSQEESSMSIEDVAKKQLNVSEKIEANTRGAIESVRLGKATTEPLEKMFTTIMGARVATSENLANTSTTKGTRETLTSLTQPIDDYIVGGVTGNDQMQKDATTNILKSLQDTETRIQTTTNDFLKSTVTDLSNILKESYSQPQKVETKSEVNLNMTINGNDNVKNMDLNSVRNDIVTYLTQTAEGKDILKKAVENPNAPTAMVGSKN